jgi:hypothetical protein
MMDAGITIDNKKETTPIVTRVYETSYSFTLLDAFLPVKAL